MTELKSDAQLRKMLEGVFKPSRPYKGSSVVPLVARALPKAVRYGDFALWAATSLLNAQAQFVYDMTPVKSTWSFGTCDTVTIPPACAPFTAGVRIPEPQACEGEVLGWSAFCTSVTDPATMPYSSLGRTKAWTYCYVTTLGTHQWAAVGFTSGVATDGKRRNEWSWLRQPIVVARVNPMADPMASGVFDDEPYPQPLTVRQLWARPRDFRPEGSVYVRPKVDRVPRGPPEPPRHHLARPPPGTKEKKAGGVPPQLFLALKYALEITEWRDALNCFYSALGGPKGRHAIKGWRREKFVYDHFGEFDYPKVNSLIKCLLENHIQDNVVGFMMVKKNEAFKKAMNQFFPGKIVVTKTSGF